MAKVEITGGIGQPGVAYLECTLSYECPANRGISRECPSCHRTIAPDVIILGRRSDGDHCFINKKIEAKWSFFTDYKVQSLHYPHVGSTQNYVITCVKVADEWKDGTGGTVTLESGGVGFDHVRVKVESKKGRGYGFDVAIYGRKI